MSFRTIDRPLQEEGVKRSFNINDKNQGMRSIFIVIV